MLESYEDGRAPEVVRSELQLDGELVVLASNECAEGPVPEALEAIARCASTVHRYPESGSRRLTDALAELHDVERERVLVGAGSCSIMHQLSLATLERGDEVAYCSPAFSAYRLEALKAGARPVEAPVRADGSCDLDALLAVVTARTRLVYVANPNNPTGGIVRRETLVRFLDALPASVLPVVDEAYLEYVDDPDYPDAIRELADDDRPVVVLRTFSKIHGLAGLRVGYAIMPEPLRERCAKLQVPYEVNRLAEDAALASLSATRELARRRDANGAERARLQRALSAAGFAFTPSSANFVRIEVGDGAGVARALERAGVIVRPLAKFGDPRAIRVTVGTPAETDVFLAALETATSDAG